MVSRACRETVSKCVHRLPNVSVWLDRQVLCQSRSNRPARMSKKNNYTATCALDSRVLEILDEFRYVCHSQFTFIILSTRRNDVQYGYHHHEQLLGSHVVLWAASSALDATSAMILGLQHLITCCSFATWIFQASKSDHVDVIERTRSFVSHSLRGQSNKKLFGPKYELNWSPIGLFPLHMLSVDHLTKNGTVFQLCLINLVLIVSLRMLICA